ncbi:MAG: hypothetical protein H7Y36_10170 [Armatimonadetes bacterium]|nr:hypothetical protein [Akkermansiaceae bacterium]
MSSLKTVARKIAELLVSSDVIWTPLSRTLVRGSQYLCAIRGEYEAREIVVNHPPLRASLANNIVIAGPFQGMKYGDTRAMCSTLYPKLLGTYEHELAQAFQSAIAKAPALVVDVGAADGYYAVGFALKNSNGKVIAYDQDPRARVELAKLAALNGVSDRIEIRERCEPQDLVSFKDKSGLMIVDCEGFEDVLLSAETIFMLKNWDFIIETHDGITPEVTKRLKERFAPSHQIEVVESVHDFDKVDHTDIPALKGLPRRSADRVLAEGREHACLRWLVCTKV